MPVILLYQTVLDLFSLWYDHSSVSSFLYTHVLIKG